MVKGNNADFITGNDNIMVGHCFNGQVGTILIMIQNYRDKALYAD